MEPLRITRGDRGPYGFARTDLLFDAFEDDHVRVCCDSDREDEAGEAGQGQRHVEDQERRVQEHGVDAEPDHRDETEEAIEDQQEERDGDETADRGQLRLPQRVPAERRRDLGLLELTEVVREGARLEHEREVLRLPDRPDAGDLGAVRARDAVRVVAEADRRSGLDLAVEDDRELLRVVVLLAARATGRLPLRPAALGERARHRLELLRARVREIHEHDRLAVLGALRPDVLAGALEVEVGPRHLRDRGALRSRVRVVLEEVVVGLRRRADVRAERRVRGALDEREFPRHEHHLGALRHLAPLAVVAHVLRVQKLPLGRERPRDELVVRRLRARLLRARLLLGGEEVELLGVLRLPLRLHRQQRVVERGQRGRVSLEIGRRRDQVALEVEELEPRGLPDHFLGAIRVDAGELDHHLVVALLPDLRLGHAELVDAPAHDRLGRVHALGGDLLASRRDRFEDDLGASLEVEAEDRLLVDRRARDREQGSPDQGHDDQAQQEEMGAALGHGAALG